MIMAEEKDILVSFKDTLNLPHTDFPIRSNAKETDPAMIERWEKEELFTKSFYHNEGNKKYILHDGPPYANGHIHIGHAYNKILKDIITKSRRMRGKQVPVTPGWDCHGLPIELKVSQENPGVSSAELKKKCREYATHWVNIQKQEFRNLGVLMDWANPYLTMDYGYEASILRAFGEFVGQGYIERKNKTVPWCASCQTVLATAEIEYQDRKDPSVYVQFPLEQKFVDVFMPDLKGEQVSLLVWTTTPWTLPLNRAVLLKPNTQYVVLKINGKYVVVGSVLAAKLCALMGVEKEVVLTFNSDDLMVNGVRAVHPFVEQLTVPVILDPSVMIEEGTACVHSAPGVGPEDYEVGVRNKLEIFSPISSDGKYTVGIMPQELEGMSVKDGQIWVLKKLTEVDKLLFKNNIQHSYPHCWRCHNGLIFRATKQWFCDLSKDNLKARVLKALEDIKTVPDNSINRLRATLEGRLEWCLSRQRVWGVPIPALLCKKCDYTYSTVELIEKVAQGVAQEGVEYWDRVALKDLVAHNFACPECKSTDFEKEHDILDVWFDAGISHFAVLLNDANLAYPANIYVEGKDQHRGWFQSSLLTSMVLEKSPCTKIIMTHGFTVDAQGRKMSKSIGNVVSPQEMIDKLGTDGLRLWAASIDNASDAVISDVLLRNVQEVFKKIRNTCRFLLSNLYDFDYATDAVELSDMRVLDHYALQQLLHVQETILVAYKDYDITAVFHKLADYCAVDLSALYLDVIKDRLYVEKADGLPRRSAQTTCWYILDTITRLIAPILSITAEQLSDHYQKDKTASIHLQNFADLEPLWNYFGSVYAWTMPQVDTMGSEHILGKTDTLKAIAKQIKDNEAWGILFAMRSAILKAIEEQRAQGIIKHSLEADVTLYIDTTTAGLAPLNNFIDMVSNSDQTFASFLKELLIVSNVYITISNEGLAESEQPGLYVKVERATGTKCPRCWHWQESKHEHGLCKRCQAIVG